MSRIVAVDGGGTGCRLVLFDAEGSLQARVEVEGHASLSRSTQEAWQNIKCGVSQLRQQLSLKEDWWPDYLMMGLAGSLQQQRRERFISYLPKGLRYSLITDGQAQLLGATAGASGICLAIGTGTVIHWQDEQSRFGMVGGWGFPVGDEGSGAWLGLRLVQVYLWHVDGQPQTSSLIGALSATIGTDVSDIQRWSTQTQSGVLAQLAPLVFDHAAAGDALAESLQQEAVDKVLALLSLAPAGLPVSVVGGIGKRLLPRLQETLDGRLRAPKGDALHGLWQSWYDNKRLRHR